MALFVRALREVKMIQVQDWTRVVGGKIVWREWVEEGVVCAGG